MMGWRPKGAETVPSQANEPQTFADELIDYSKLGALLREGGASKYQHNSPFQHIFIDDFLAKAAAENAYREIVATDVPREKINYSTYLKYRLSDPAKLGPAVAGIIDELNSPRFIHFLEKLTGIDELVADPSLEGGGIHRIGTGGFLKVHTDFNFHRLTGMFRRLNILVYLNPEWEECWGGAIELWHKDMSRCGAAYAPIWNRAVIFSTTDESFHGHPDPLTSPEGVFRNSIALYYYTRDLPESGYRFDRSEMTNYQPRPGERFEGVDRLTHFLHQTEIRHPRLRKLTAGLKRLLG
jgi:Rps23 Pro-64 3,4-dihydroxylase Tpa1-like proline 4-hydroxylase